MPFRLETDSPLSFYYSEIFSFKERHQSKVLQIVFTSEAVLLDKWIYQSLKAKLCKIQYLTVWPLAVKLPVNICSVHYFKLALMMCVGYN